MNAEQKNILRYIAKCVTGALIVVAVGEALPMVDISWVLISMVLVLSPDSKEAIPLTIIRVKANLVASVVTILMLLVMPSMALAICVAFIITIGCCYFLKLMDGSRAALAAVIIIALHPAGEHLWSTASARLLSVVAGCALALALTFLFHRGIAFGKLRNDKFIE